MPYSTSRKYTTGRARFLLLAFLVCTGASLLWPAGCSQGSQQAREHAKAGDAAMKGVPAEALGLARDLEGFFADLVEGYNTEPFGVKHKMNETAKRMAGIDERCAVARTEYEKVIRDPDAGAYADYARLWLEMIDDISAIRKTMDQVFPEIDRQLGTDADLKIGEQLQQGTRALILVEEEVNYLRDEALQIKKEDGL